MEKQKITVIFRAWKHKPHTIIALFPYEEADHQGRCLSYEHIGQHGAADYSYVIAATHPATPNSYARLKHELENLVGYELTIRQRRVRK